MAQIIIGVVFVWFGGILLGAFAARRNPKAEQLNDEAVESRKRAGESFSSWFSAMFISADFLEAMVFAGVLLYIELHPEYRAYVLGLLAATVAALIVSYIAILHMAIRFLKWSHAYYEAARLRGTSQLSLVQDGTFADTLKKHAELGDAIPTGVSMLGRWFLRDYSEALIIGIVFIYTDMYTEVMWLPVVSIALYCVCRDCFSRLTTPYADRLAARFVRT